MMSMVCAQSRTSCAEVMTLAGMHRRPRVRLLIVRRFVSPMRAAGIIDKRRAVAHIPGDLLRSSASPLLPRLAAAILIAMQIAEDEKRVAVI